MESTTVDVGEPGESEVTVSRIGRSFGADRWAKFGDTVAVIYKGYTAEGKLFDSTEERRKPLRFVLGKCQVPEGWEIAILKMTEGAEYRVKMPAKFAFDKRGIPGLIPPNSMLTFEMTLLEIN